ncbi:MAG TPA: hypothetical protein VLS89_09170 [Candidatus Nanopelagicales bacterium]|nr:hypothetical protein [Candidatus Nanopelagicales bacterium]
MEIRVIDRLVDGDPVLLVPDGLLLRWPQDEPRPVVGERFHGQTVTVTRQQDRQDLYALLHGNILERCDAALRLPVPLVCVFYSRQHAMNLRRIAQSISPGLRAHVAEVLSDGMRVSSKILLRAVARRTESAQFQAWNKGLE